MPQRTTSYGWIQKLSICKHSSPVGPDHPSGGLSPTQGQGARMQTAKCITGSRAAYHTNVLNMHRLQHSGIYIYDFLDLASSALNRIKTAAMSQVLPYPATRPTCLEHVCSMCTWSQALDQGMPQLYVLPASCFSEMLQRVQFSRIPVGQRPSRCY
jgi:hypothetical protein